jgi:hypothetical protein
VLRVLEPSLRMKAQADSNSRGWKDFICREEKRRERLHSGECRGTWKPEIPWVGLGIGFNSLFCIAWGQRCLSGADRGFLGRKDVSLTTYHLLGPPAVCPSVSIVSASTKV